MKFINRIIEADNLGTPLEHAKSLTQTLKFVSGKNTNFIGEYSLLNEDMIHMMASRT